MGRPRTKVWWVSVLTVPAFLAAMFVLESIHYNDTVLSSDACPQPQAMNAALGTKLDTVSALQLLGLHSCHYGQGADLKALWIDVADAKPGGRTNDDPCHDKTRLNVAGHVACSVSGTRATTRGRPSLYVETSKGDWQLTTNLPTVSMSQLEALAKTLINSKRPLFA
jgi:hypothetical protein